ncbi:MAG: response regulator [Bacteroidales bacterium]|nr:response regulator [Bacteroidales bacterium]
MKFRSLILCILCCVQCFAALNTKVLQITVDDGLINGNIHQICQDSQGFIWIATENGLVRYDGFDYKVFQTNSKSGSCISHNFVNAVATQDGGFIWIGTMSGVDRYDTKTGKFNHFYFYNTLGNFNMKPALQVCPVDSGCIVRSDDKALYFCKIGNDTIAPVSYRQFESNTFIMTIDLAENQIIAGNKDGDVFCLNKDGKATLLAQRDASITCVKILNNTILACYADGVVISIENNGQSKEYTFPQKNVYVTSIVETDSLVLLGTRAHGVFEFSKDGQLKSAAIRNLVNQSCSTLYTDCFDNVWVGHSSGGITVELAESVDYVSSDSFNSLNGVKVISVAQSKEYYCIGTDGYGLYLFDKRTGSKHIYNAQSGLDDVVTSLAVEGNMLWIGTYNKGVFCMSLVDYTFLYVNELQQCPEKNISSVFVDSQRNVWIGTYESGVLVFNQKLQKFDRHYTGYEGDAYQTISCNGITEFFEDSNNNIWLGSYYGLTKITKNNEITIYRYDDFPGMRSSVVTIIEQDLNGRIWFGSLQGLSYYDEKQDTIVALKNAASANSMAVNEIVVQPDGSLIIVTPKYVYVFDSEKNVFQYVSTLKKGEFAKNSCAIVDNTVLIGTDKGIKELTFPIQQNSTVGRSLQLTDVTVQRKSVYSIDSKYEIVEKDGVYYLDLPYFEKDISFSFSDFYFDENRTHDFVYSLIGLSDQKILLQNENTVSYTNLQGGDYVFTVQSLDNEEEKIEVRIHIAKAFWESKLFYVVLIAVILASIIFVFVRRMRMVVRMRNKLQKQMEYRVKDIERKTKQIELQNEQIRLQRDAATRQRSDLEKQRSGLEKKLSLLSEKIQKDEDLLEDFKQKTVALNKEKQSLKRKLDLFEDTVRDAVIRISLPSESIDYVSPSVVGLTGYEDFDLLDIQIFKDLFPKESWLQYRSTALAGTMPEVSLVCIQTKHGEQKNIKQVAHYEIDGSDTIVALELLWIDENKPLLEVTSEVKKKVVDEPLVEQYDWTNKTILVGDADDQSFAFIKDCLEPTHIEIVRAFDGEHVLQLCKQMKDSINLMLLDVSLPKKNGFETANTLRENEIRIPIIAQTQYENYEAKIQCFDAGCSSYISKPYKIADLQKVVLKYIGE